MAHEKSIESWKLVPLPKITTTSTVGGEPFFPFFPYHSVPKHIKSLPSFVPPISYDTFPTEDPRLQCHLKRTSSAKKVYGWNFPPQGSTQLSDDNSSPKPPDEDICALSIDEHVGCSSSSVNNDAGTMNKTTTCDGEFSKPPPPPGDGEFNQPPGEETIKPPPLGDSIPFTAAGSQEGRCARDSSSSSSSACYMCGEAQHFARKCSLGANTTA